MMPSFRGPLCGLSKRIVFALVIWLVASVLATPLHLWLEHRGEDHVAHLQLHDAHYHDDDDHSDDDPSDAPSDGGRHHHSGHSASDHSLNVVERAPLNLDRVMAATLTVVVADVAPPSETAIVFVKEDRVAVPPDVPRTTGRPRSPPPGA